MHDDGDEEDLEEDEVVQGGSLYAEHPAARRFEEKAAKAREAEEAATSVELEGWRLEGHALVRRRVARSFDEGGHTLGLITRWLPADEASGDGALFHAVHDDGDEEDLEEDEAAEAAALLEALGAEARAAAAECARTRLVQPKYENKQLKKGERAEAGHLGVEGARAEIGALEQALLPGLRAAGSRWVAPKARIRVRWLQSLDEAERASELAAALVELEQHLRELQSAADVSERKPWRSDAHEWLGRSVRRFFWLKSEQRWLCTDASVGSWLPAEGSDVALWHVTHDDGDRSSLRSGGFCERCLHTGQS